MLRVGVSACGKNDSFVPICFYLYYRFIAHICPLWVWQTHQLESAFHRSSPGPDTLRCLKPNIDHWVQPRRGKQFGQPVWPQSCLIFGGDKLDYIVMPPSALDRLDEVVEENWSPEFPGRMFQKQPHCITIALWECSVRSPQVVKKVKASHLPQENKNPSKQLQHFWSLPSLWTAIKGPSVSPRQRTRLLNQLVNVRNAPLQAQPENWRPTGLGVSLRLRSHMNPWETTSQHLVVLSCSILYFIVGWLQ